MIIIDILSVKSPDISFVEVTPLSYLETLTFFCKPSPLLLWIFRLYKPLGILMIFRVSSLFLGFSPRLILVIGSSPTFCTSSNSIVMSSGWSSKYRDRVRLLSLSSCWSPILVRSIVLELVVS